MTPGLRKEQAMNEPAKLLEHASASRCAFRG